MDRARGFDLFPADDEERESLIRAIAQITGEPLVVVDRRAGASVETLRAEMERVMQ